MTHKFTVASHNVLYKLADEPEKWAADLAKTAKAHVRGFQEASATPARKAILAHLAKVGHKGYLPTHGDPIAWNPDVFDEAGVLDGQPYAFSVKSHDAAKAVGVPTHVNPARYITGKGLVHRETGKRILFLNVHPSAGATSPEATNDFGPRLDAWKNFSIRRYWLDVVRITARELRRDEFFARTETAFGVDRQWDAIVLLGDFNAKTSAEAEWYFPGAMLDGLYGPDLRSEGLDHIIATHDADLQISKRYVVTKGVFTDHALHFADVTL